MSPEDQTYWRQAAEYWRREKDHLNRDLTFLRDRLADKKAECEELREELTSIKTFLGMTGPTDAGDVADEVKTQITNLRELVALQSYQVSESLTSVANFRKTLRPIQERLCELRAEGHLDYRTLARAVLDAGGVAALVERVREAAKITSTLTSDCHAQGCRERDLDNHESETIATLRREVVEIRDLNTRQAELIVHLRRELAEARATGVKQETHDFAVRKASEYLARAEAAERALGAVEWSAYDETSGDPRDDGLCPECRARKADGHSAECIVGQALRAAEPGADYA